MDSQGFPSATFFRRLGARMADDSELSLSGRFLDLALGFASDGTSQVLEIVGGQLIEVHPGGSRPPELLLCGTSEEWARFLVAVPAPGYVDVVGMDRRGKGFSIEGDPVLLARHLRALTRLLRLCQLEAASNADG